VLGRNDDVVLYGGGGCGNSAHADSLGITRTNLNPSVVAGCQTKASNPRSRFNREAKGPFLEARQAHHALVRSRCEAETPKTEMRCNLGQFLCHEIACQSYCQNLQAEEKPRATPFSDCSESAQRPPFPLFPPASPNIHRKKYLDQTVKSAHEQQDPKNQPQQRPPADPAQRGYPIYSTTKHGAIW
jgi:hypothetical protein